VNIGQLIAAHGYLALFILVALESLGVPLPGETALITAGIYAGHTHRLSPWLIFAVAAAAAIIGDNIGYWIGNKGGYRLARRYGPRVHLDEQKLKIARYLFDRYGTPVVFFGRFVSILRTYAAFLAGASKMRWRKFLPANAAGGIVWAGIYTLAAYLAGNALKQASGIITWTLVAAAAAAIAAALIWARRKTSKLAARAEAAYPGPLEQ
jgi:membrane protein DedA with SNARE-associated domain